MKNALSSIVQVVADGAPGGGTNVVLSLCQALVQRGVRTTLITAPNSYAASQARSIGARAIPVDFSQRGSLGTITRLAKHFRELKPDLVHAHGARAGLPSALALTMSSIPLAYTVHGFHFQKKTGAVKQAAILAERLIAHSANRLILVSEGDAAVASSERIGKKASTTVIKNGINIAGLREAVASRAERYDVAFVGRFVAQKNPTILPEIMALLPDVRMIAVGGGVLLDEVRARAGQLGLGDRISFLGEMPHEQALAALAQARLLVFPSLWEGHPLTPMEAAALGIPVVASNVPGTDEVVKDGITGRLVSGFQPSDFAKAIGELLESRRGLSDMAMTAKSWALAEFDNRQSVDRHVTLYLEILAAHH